MLEELGRDVLVDGIRARELERNRQQVEAIRRHPARPVGLLEPPSRRQSGRPVERADVVETEEAAFEDVVAFGVLAVHPPREVDQELLERALEKGAVAPAVDLPSIW
jgi:hypothetical protein